MELPIETVINLMVAMSTQTLRAGKLDPSGITEAPIHNRFYVADLIREVVQLGLEQGINLQEELAKVRERRFQRSEAPRLVSSEEYDAMLQPKE